MPLIDIVTQGTTDYSCSLRVVDSTDGTPETSVAYDTPGVDLWYRRPGAAHTSITEADLAAETTAHTDGGFLHISDGVCRLDLPDAAVAAGADYVDVGGTFTGMIVMGGRIRLSPVERGLAGTALPATASGAAGGLPNDTDANGRVRVVSGTAAGELNLNSGGVDVTRWKNDTNIADNVETAFGTPNFQKGYDETENTWIVGPDFVGVVGAVPTPTNTEFASTAFTASDTNSYLGDRITFVSGAARAHQQCIVTAYDGAGKVTVTPIPGGAPGVGNGFHCSTPRDK